MSSDDSGAIVPSGNPLTNSPLDQMPREQLIELAYEMGLDARQLNTKAALVAAIADRRNLVASLDKQSLTDVLRWAGRNPPANATREQMAQQIARIRSMRFNGLSQRGLICLARLRGIDVTDDMATPQLIERLKRQEGIFAKLGRKRRAWMGKMVSRMLGENAPDQAIEQAANPDPSRPFHHEVEESGLIAGLTSRVKRSADQYLNQKLDEIEARIDRKLDEIDRRLADWRDKEVANRIRILKITLWASVIVAAISLVYSYVSVYWQSWFGN